MTSRGLQPYMKRVAEVFLEKPRLTHRQKVTRLYRHSLRLLMSWAVDREIICDEAEKIRAEFDKYKHLPKDSGCVAPPAATGARRAHPCAPLQPRQKEVQGSQAARARHGAPGPLQACVSARHPRTHLCPDRTPPPARAVPYMPGGSKFMRNPPVQLDVVYEGEVPADVQEKMIPVHVDQVPVTFRPAPTVAPLVDFSRKNLAQYYYQFEEQFDDYEVLSDEEGMPRQ